MFKVYSCETSYLTVTMIAQYAQNDQCDTTKNIDENLIWYMYYADLYILAEIFGNK